MNNQQQEGVVNIHGFPDYTVSRCGRVFSLPRIRKCEGRSDFRINGRELRAGTTKAGYKMVALGRGNCRYVHRLVAESFLGPCPDGLEVCHNDGNPANNHISNLRYGTRKENTEDSRRHGTMRVGEDRHTSKLTEAQVAAVVNAAYSGWGHAARMARQLGVSPNTIYDILNGRTWTHVK